MTAAAEVAGRNTLARLGARRLLVVTGKGGVGKSTVSAALGTLLARHGRKVLLLEADARESLHRFVGLPPSGGEVLAAGERLWLQGLDPRAVIEEQVRGMMPLPFLAGRLLSSPVFHNFAEGAPGIRELAVLGHAARQLEGAAIEPAPDLVILDAPATGHGVSLLSAPGLVKEVVRSGPFGRLAEELDGFLRDPERCGLVLVSLAEEMPVQEAVELRQRLRDRLDREPDLLVVNGLYPPAPDDGRDAVHHTLWRRRRQVNEREMARLERDWDGPRAHLALQPLGSGAELVAALCDPLAAQLGNRQAS